MTNIPEFTVSQFSRSLKNIVEDAFGYVRIKGEITGFKRATSGHLYFSLKDEEACLSAVCFKNMADLIALEMADGLQILASGRITTFAGRSSYQIVVEKVEISGIGAILEMIEKRRQKLAAEGLFDAQHKKPIPFFPKIIGVITSPTGAVIQDILHRVEARCPTHIKLYGAAVQGKEVVREIVAGINYFNKLKNEERPEVLIIARGGGSFEDLLPFNDEAIVRAVFACDIPIISAVGHETDTTLIDFVSDLRAPTPTAAAEIATVVLTDLKNSLQYQAQQMKTQKERALLDRQKHLDNLQKYLIGPAKMLENMARNFKMLQEKLLYFAHNNLNYKMQKLQNIAFSSKMITRQVYLTVEKIDNLGKALKSRARAIIENIECQLNLTDKLLQSGHYKKILQRGFSLVKNKNGKLVTSANDLKAKDEIAIEMSDGEFQAYVLGSKKKEEKIVDIVQPRLF